MMATSPTHQQASRDLFGLKRGEINGGHNGKEPPPLGWYIDVARDGHTYLVGASGESEGSPPEKEWIIQVNKHRSLKEKFLGKNKMPNDDPLVALIEKLVRADPQMSGVTVDRDA